MGRPRVCLFLHRHISMLKKQNYKQQADKITQWIDDYFNKLESLPVKSQVKPGDILSQLPEEAPINGEGFSEIIKDLDKIIVPGITHWQHPNFHAYFAANSSVESVLAETVTAAIGAQCMIWDTSPAAAELEERMMEWLRIAMGIPDTFEGVIQDTASTATLASIITAREVKTNFESNEIGVPQNLRVYCSSEAHSSIEKAVGICGIGKRNLIKIAVDDQMRMIPAALENQIIQDISEGFVPCCAIAAIGTTGTLAVDPLDEIGKICEKYKVWLHVDAAYAGTALLLTEYRWMIKGIERADSFVFNPHKWMFTNFDCSVYFVKDVKCLTRVFEVLPEYLKTSTRGLVNDYRDWGIPLGRRFRALKLWFVMRSYGISGIKEALRKHLALTQLFAKSLLKNKQFQLLFDPFLNFTCFRFVPEGNFTEEELNELNEKLLRAINSTGKVFLTHTKVNGKYAIRMLIGQTYVEETHVEKVLGVIYKEIENIV